MDYKDAVVISLALLGGTFGASIGGGVGLLVGTIVGAVWAYHTDLRERALRDGRTD
ncbi:hypothetical protein [Natronorarus salvus]|uniref:hypothetical protein n=1 Tax=Natronorarus salvus TaxID=3117733 RepID=UPI002F26AF2D